MAITYPYSLANFSDLLKIETCVFDLERFDEHSGDGDGRTWQAELAPPLWNVKGSLTVGYWNDLKKIQALFRRLKGSQEAFFLCDPIAKYPQTDPDGSILGSSNVQVHTIGTNRDTVRFKGLPSTFALKAGDRFQINYSSNPTLSYYGEVSEDVTAVSGTTPEFAIYPNLRTGIAVNDVVILKKPACKFALVSYDAGQSETIFTRGIAFEARERKR